MLLKTSYPYTEGLFCAVRTKWCSSHMASGFSLFFGALRSILVSLLYAVFQKLFRREGEGELYRVRQYEREHAHRKRADNANRLGAGVDLHKPQRSEGVAQNEPGRQAEYLYKRLFPEQGGHAPIA